MKVAIAKSILWFNKEAWVIRSILKGRYVKHLVILISLSFLSASVQSQCPTENYCRQKVASIYAAKSKTNETKLDELLRFQQQMKSCQLDRDSSFMFLLQKIGVLYFKQSDYTNAIGFTKQSVFIAKERMLNQPGAALALAYNYYNLYYYYLQTKQLQNKYNAIDSCVFYVLKANSGFDMAIKTLKDKLDYLFNKGEYGLCIENAKLAEEITQQYYHSKDSIDYIVSFATHRVNALYYSNNFDASERILAGKIEQFKKTGNGKYLGPFYTLSGIISTHKKKYSEALLYFQDGFKAFSVIKFPSGCAQNLAYIGNLNAKYFHKYEIGLKYSADALEYADPTDSIFILKQMGSIYAAKKMFDKAQYYFQWAFNTVWPGMNESTLLLNAFQFPSFNQLQDLSDLTTEKGDAFVLQYYHTKKKIYLKKAIGIYKKNDLFLAKVKSEQHLQFSSNLIWRTTARHLYEHAIEACYSDNNMEDAFYFFEKSRSVLLNDQINEQRWMADEDIAKQAALKKEVIELERKLARLEMSTKEYLVTQKNIYTASEDMSSLTRNIQIKNPFYFKNYLDTNFISIQQLKDSILNNSKSLVEIFSGDSAQYILTITPKTQTLRKINLSMYDSLTKSFIGFITNNAALNRHYPQFLKTAHALYKILFSANEPPPGSLIISPDGKNFPFEALVINENLQRPEYLLNNYATSYTYSVKYLMNDYSITKKNNSKGILGIAPVKYNRYSSLSKLSGSDMALQQIKQIFPGTTLLEFENASKHNFLNNFTNYSIIQFYTHASDTSTNNDPVIYFADSALYLSELLADHKPQTRLVVLSACETANGKLYSGEGIFSFNRGFAALGIPAAISNLWSVEDVSTYKITTLFYKYLSKGFATDIALQKAKLEFISESSSTEKRLPFFWAGPVLTGKVEKLTMPKSYPWTAITTGTIFLIIVVFFTKLYSKQKNKY